MASTTSLSNTSHMSSRWPPEHLCQSHNSIAFPNIRSKHHPDIAANSIHASESIQSGSAHEMILSAQPLLFYLAQQTIATTNIIQANALNFHPQPITMHPTLKPRTPTFPEPTPTTTPPAQLLQQNSACQLVGEALAICDSLTPGFNTLQPTDQAHCLCYSSTSWMPNIFDGAVKTCADYASTAVPGAFPSLSNLEDFCQGVGDVETSLPSPPTSTTISPSITSTSFSISAFSGQPCNSANEILNSCSSQTPGFSSLQPTEQAKCLCYVSASWCPSAFDNAVATCAVYAKTGASSAYAAIAPLTGFCGSVGSYLTTTPASYSVATTLSVVSSTTITAETTSAGMSGNGGTSTSMVLATTITIGGAKHTQANSGVTGHKQMSEGSVVGFSLFCALLVLFL
jgi:hypothetical protein